jgi:hypothetical protein
VIGQKGVDPQAAAALHELAWLGLRLILASNAAGDALACASDGGRA